MSQTPVDLSNEVQQCPKAIEDNLESREWLWNLVAWLIQELRQANLVEHLGAELSPG